MVEKYDKPHSHHPDHPPQKTEKQLRKDNGEFTESEKSELILEAFNAYFSMIRTQNESYNKFLITDLPGIITENNVIIVERKDKLRRDKVEFLNLCLAPPDTIDPKREQNLTTPKECRLLSQTYGRDILLDVIHTRYIRPNTSSAWKAEARIRHQEISIGRLPMMLKSIGCVLKDDFNGSLSGECGKDPGGTFIISGYEKTVVAQEDLMNNYPFVSSAKATGKYSHQCEIRSWSETKIRSTSTIHMYICNNITKGKAAIDVCLPFLDKKTPLVLLMLALGVPPDKLPNLILEGSSFEDDAEIACFLKNVCDVSPYHGIVNNLDDVFAIIGQKISDIPIVPPKETKTESVGKRTRKNAASTVATRTTKAKGRKKGEDDEDEIEDDEEIEIEGEDDEVEGGEDEEGVEGAEEVEGVEGVEGGDETTEAIPEEGDEVEGAEGAEEAEDVEGVEEEELDEEVEAVVAESEQLPEPTVEKIPNNEINEPEEISQDNAETSEQETTSTEQLKQNQKNRSNNYARYIIGHEFLPHIGSEKMEDNQFDAEIRSRKIYYIILAVRKLIEISFGRIPDKDNEKDNMAYKRLKTTGMLFAFLFRQLYRKMITGVRNFLKKVIEKDRWFKITDLIKRKTITGGLTHALASGNWTIRKGETNQTGVSQQLTRLNLLSTLAHLRRWNLALKRQGKNPKPRQLQTSSWGLACPIETPEGQSCGLVKSQALFLNVRVGYSSSFIEELVFDVSPVKIHSLCELGGIDLPTVASLTDGKTAVWINRSPIGWVETREGAQRLINKLRTMRENCDLPYDISISLQKEGVIISCCSGGMTRCVMKSDKIDTLDELLKDPLNRGRTLWYEMIRHKVVEFLDKEEENEPSDGPKVALKADKNVIKGHSHCELTMRGILGLTAAAICRPHHNQVVRNMFWTSMGKAGQGIPYENFHERTDSQFYILHYGQRPLVSTDVLNVLDPLSFGLNAVVAVMPRNGKNQEDALTVNKGFIDRGAMRTTMYRTYRDEERGPNSSIEWFAVPDPETCINMKHASLSLLEDDGLPAVNLKIRSNDIICGKLGLAQPAVPGQKPVYKDLSMPVRAADILDTLPTVSNYGGNSGKKRKRTESNESTTTDSDGNPTKTRIIGHDVAEEDIIGAHGNTVVDQVLVCSTTNGNRISKIRCRTIRVPQIGDKLSSRHGQKGVIGEIEPQEDMPFSLVTGMTPDIIINPHAIPTRMTLGQIFESLQGKATALSGEFYEGSCFGYESTEGTDDGDLKIFGDVLKKHGFEAQGYETFADGRTGEIMKGKIFVGLVHYERLKHMVDDKIHARATGPVQFLTRQPVEGRSRDGGLRFGEMERDCLISHAVANFIKDRLVDCSDGFDVPLCGNCGLLVDPPVEQHMLPFCKPCRTSDKVVWVRIPYAAKLLFQELQSMLIVVRLYPMTKSLLNESEAAKFAIKVQLPKEISPNNITKLYDAFSVAPGETSKQEFISHYLRQLRE